MNKTTIKQLTLNEVRDLDLGAKVFLLLSRNNFLECYHCIYIYTRRNDTGSR